MLGGTEIEEPGPGSGLFVVVGADADVAGGSIYAPGMTDQAMSESRARTLVDSILSLSRQHDFPALLRIALDPETSEALDLLPEKATATARVQLQGALKWRTLQYERNTERLDEVREALNAYDLSLARGLLRRVESHLVADSDRDRFNEMLLEVESRAMAAEELTDLAESIDPPKQAKKRRWFRR